MDATSQVTTTSICNFCQSLYKEAPLKTAALLGMAAGTTHTILPTFNFGIRNAFFLNFLIIAFQSKTFSHATVSLLLNIITWIFAIAAGCWIQAQFDLESENYLGKLIVASFIKQTP